jgi:hypothetical protein
MIPIHNEFSVYNDFSGFNGRTARNLNRICKFLLQDRTEREPAHELSGHRFCVRAAADEQVDEY